MADPTGVLEKVEAIATKTSKELEEFKKTNAELKGLLAQQASEIKENGGTSAELSKQIKELEKKYDQGLKDLEGKFDTTPEYKDIMEKRIDELEAMLKKARGEQSEHGGPASAAHKFVNSEHYKKFHPSSNPRTERIEVGRVIEKKAISGDAALRQILSTRTIQTIQFEQVLRNKHLREYLVVIKAPDSIVQFLREKTPQEGGFVNNAGFQVEGEAKALSDFDFEVDEASAKTIAHGTPITRQLAADAPGLTSHIEMRLIEGLYHKEDTALLFSTGTSGSFKGITQYPIQPFTRGVAGDTKIDNIRRSHTQLQKKHYIPDLTVLSPEDWEDIELEKDDDKRYIWNQLTVPGFVEAILWRTPVFVSDMMTEGKFLTGDFRAGCTIYDLEEAFMQIFDQHSDWALKNQLLLLAEMREIFVVERYSAFVYGTFGQVGSGSGS